MRAVCFKFDMKRFLQFSRGTVLAVTKAGIQAASEPDLPTPAPATGRAVAPRPGGHSLVLVSWRADSE